MTAAVLALAGALAYGTADFAGGLAATRTRALLVTVVAQAVGLVVLLPALALLAGVPSVAAVGLGAAAGVAGTLALAMYYRALAIGPMGVVSPLAAVVGALVPLVAGLAAGERPGGVALAGVALAVAAVILATAGGSVAGGPGAAPPTTRPVAVDRSAASGGGRRAGWRGLPAGPVLGVVSGLGFGAFFVVLDATPADSGLWPLLGTRSLSVLVLLPVLAAMVMREHRRRVALGQPSPARFPWRATIVAGVLDQGANVLFLLATREGLLSLSGVLVSLYPVVVVLLAAVVLHERLNHRQQLGAAGALVAALLAALG